MELRGTRRPPTQRASSTDRDGARSRSFVDSYVQSLRKHVTTNCIEQCAAAWRFFEMQLGVECENLKHVAMRTMTVRWVGRQIVITHVGVLARRHICFIVV